MIDSLIDEIIDDLIERILEVGIFYIMTWISYLDLAGRDSNSFFSPVNKNSTVNFAVAEEETIINAKIMTNSRDNLD